jgi:hypothetical protein
LRKRLIWGELGMRVIEKIRLTVGRPCPEAGDRMDGIAPGSRAMKPMVSPHVRIRHPDHFEVGDDSIVDDFATFDARAHRHLLAHRVRVLWPAAATASSRLAISQPVVRREDLVHERRLRQRPGHDRADAAWPVGSTSSKAT